MGKYRKRFNEKARAGMLAKQAALKKARNKQFTRHFDDGTQEAEPVQAENPNAEILKPLTEEEKAERKRRLEETLYSANERETKMSKAKKKRLDKYIEHQLKREEKKVLLEKLATTKMDTTNLVASKNLGKGKQTRREEMVEALSLEQQGRADQHTRDVLYEEHQVKDDWEESDNSDDRGSDDDWDTGDSKSTFVDNRPAKFGGTGTGFGFGDLPKVKKAKKKYNWRLAVEREEKKRRKAEDEDDFASESENEDKEDSDQAIIESDAEDSDNPDSESDEAAESESESDEAGESESESEEAESESESDEAAESESDSPQLKPKHSKTATSFKEWAEQQVAILEGRTEMVMPELSEETKKKYSKPTHHAEDFDHSSDEEGYVPIDKTMQREAFYVAVTRDEEIQQSRMQLPVFAEEHRIMEAINHHDCVVICGETGSGKTTQVPQFLYEAGFGNTKHPMYPGMIGVTQPRRVAAVSMAKRVANELGDHGSRVGHQIRFDSTIKNEGQEGGTAMKFMTDGVLLREMMTDLMLSKYSCLIIDEAHERNINTDILIGMLSRVLKLRRKYHMSDPKYKPLKLIIMSATLRVADFSENTALFPSPPPVLKVDARQYPVSVHFSKRTSFDYVAEATRKALKIHQKLPPGGILIFLTGQQEITQVVRQLRETKSVQKIDDELQMRSTEPEAEEIDFGVERMEIDEEDDYEDSDEEGFDMPREESQSDDDTLHVLPLYSLLPTKEQMKVFEAPPPGSRLCIVATNVAETSLTIPGIRYVVDCGRAKERRFNRDTGVQSFEVDWVSKASADQRAGRAGRTGPGHCYRLYSSAVYENHFPQFSLPEILRMPFESVVLSMKAMSIDRVHNFPFPTPPDRDALRAAERLLINLGALDKSGIVTELGRTMAAFPLSPRFAKILIVGDQLQCLPYIVTIVSALTVGDPFLGEAEVVGKKSQEKQRDVAKDVGSDSEDEKKRPQPEKNTPEENSLLSKYRRARGRFSRLDPSSDALALLAAVCAADHVPSDQRSDFYRDNFMRQKSMEEISKLRKQVDYLVRVHTSPGGVTDTPKDFVLGVPSKKQIQALKQMVASGFVDQVAVRADLVSAEVPAPKNTIMARVPYIPVFPVHVNDPTVSPFVYVHAGSAAASVPDPKPYFVYLSLSTGVAKDGRAPRVRMRPLVDLSARQLASVAKNTPLLTYSKPLGHPYAPKMLGPTKRECYVVPRFGAAIGTGGTGWELPAVKVVQEKKMGGWVTS